MIEAVDSPRFPFQTNKKMLRKYNNYIYHIKNSFSNFVISISAHSNYTALTVSSEFPCKGHSFFETDIFLLKEMKSTYPPSGGGGMS